jgi:D-alanyl-D-alanine carboxypeptidase
VRRKLAAGVSVEDVLCVNAPPGFSEHHTGRALDLTTPRSPVLETGFEQTPAFAWLLSRADEFGFVLSYPRGNPCGFQYEPWHWCYRVS